jgi:predicted lipoprotein with Yx(FWY)xxD motif
MNHASLKLAGLGALTLLAAGCGAAASAGPYVSHHPTSTINAAASTIVGVRASPLGRIIVGSGGRTLYLFEKDRSGSSACYGPCASIWPPLRTTGAVKAPPGLPARIGTIKRSDGTAQVTYNGHPLYYYVGDTAAGQTRGEGLDQFGAGWYVLAPTGNKVDNG